VSGIRFEETAIPGLLVVKPQVFTDERGSFTKTFVAEEYAVAGLAITFAEEYRTRSVKGVVRGMHFQLPPHDHEKLVFCADGVVMDVILDLRRGSRTFGQTLTFALEGPTGFGLYIPVGCAHGFCSLSDESTMEYRVSGAYSPEHDAGVLWSSVDVEWPIGEPIVSARDAAFPELADFESPFTIEGVRGLG
jgi:dTDP-4-dehydrorhamnose 3,5-epimerase